MVGGHDFGSGCVCGDGEDWSVEVSVRVRGTGVLGRTSTRTSTH